MALKERIFDITEPLVYLFTAVEDLMELAEASDTPFTEKQQIKLGVQLIKNLGEMEKSRAKWLTLSPANKTWVKFK